VEGRVESGREGLEIGVVELEAETLGFLNYPVKGFVGEAIGRVPAADVAVDTGEPGLFKFARPAMRAGPEVRPERIAALVYGERMIGVLDVRVQLNIVIPVLVLVASQVLPPACQNSFREARHHENWGLSNAIFWGKLFRRRHLFNWTAPRRTFDLAALLSLVSSVSAGITSSRHDAHLDKLRPNASHRLRDPCVEGRAFTAANQNFAEEIRNRQPGVKKVLDQPLG
jgi:hypothetical protein